MATPATSTMASTAQMIRVVFFMDLKNFMD